MGRRKLDSKTKFWSKTDKRSDNECWKFIGGKDKDGYGQFWDGDNQKHTRAHIYSAELHLGGRPAMLCVCHTCDTPDCVNPAHLFYGTQKQNIADKVGKNRQAKGEMQGHHKLTEAQVSEIRQRANEGYRKLCEEFQLVPSTVYRIWHGQAWKHLHANAR